MRGSLADLADLAELNGWRGVAQSKRCAAQPIQAPRHACRILIRK
jgi:hypothetical protein